MMIDWGAMLPEHAARMDGDPDALVIPESGEQRPHSLGEQTSASPRSPVALRNDDMRYCVECGNLAESGRCLAALRREFVASRNYQPVRDILLRCSSFIPLVDDPDQRTGRMRWPGL